MLPLTLRTTARKIMRKILGSKFESKTKVENKNGMTSRKAKMRERGGYIINVHKCWLTACN